jgi:hypothetical protein
MSDDELISSARAAESERMEVYLAKLMVFGRGDNDDEDEVGGAASNLTFADDVSRSLMKDAMSSSSVFALPLLPGRSFSFESLLPRPEEVLLSAALLLEVQRRGRLAKLLLYLTGAGFGDEDAEDANVASGADGVRRCCCGRRGLNEFLFP